MVLFTSAVPGKKAAPKAPARRRPVPAPTGPPPSAQQPEREREASTATEPPSQPPTVIDDAPVQHQIPPAKDPEQPPSEPVREPEVEQTQSEPEPEPVNLPTQPPPASEPVVEAAPEPVVEQEPIPPPSAAPEPALERLPTPERTQPGAQEAQQPETQRVQASAVEQSPARSLQEQRLEEFRQATTAHVLEAATAGATNLGKRAAIEAPTPAGSRPAKKAKRSSTRSNAKVTAVANGEDVPAPGPSADGDGDAVPAAAPPKTKRTKKPAAESPTATRRSTRTTKATPKKSASTIIDSDDEMEGLESTTAGASEQEGQARETVTQDNAEVAAPTRKPRAKPTSDPTKPKRTRKKKMPTIAEEAARIEEENESQQDAADESDPELHEIDPNTLSMWDLSYDSRHGQMSERGKKMNEIDWEEVAAKRRMEANLIAAGGADQTAPESTAPSTEARSGANEGQAEGGADGEQNAAPSSATPAPDADDDGIGFTMDEDGQIVVDQATTQIDRTADALAAISDKPVEDVNDLTTQINRTSWINNNRREATDRVPMWKWKSDPWSEEETDRFYDALRMFGTDFLVISKMFPAKTRRMIKSKFTREEKLDGQRVTDALLGRSTVRMDLDHYARETSRDISVFTKYESLEHAQAVINESMKEKQEAMTTAVQQEAQLEAEKREKEKEREKDKARRPRAKGKKAKVAGTFGGGGPEDGD